MHKESLDLLYIGPLWEGGTCLQRMNAIKELGHNVCLIDTHPDCVRNLEKAMRIRILQKLFGHSECASTNEGIVSTLHRQRFDIIWIDKGLTIYPHTFKVMKQLCPCCKIVGYSPDDMTNRGNQSRHLLKGLPFYDIYFTTKSYGVADLKNLGCKHVEFIGNAYDPHIHRPMSVSNEIKSALGGTVGFIGQWEKKRTESLRFLAESGIDVRVWGYTWERCKRRPKLLRLENKPLWGDDYARAICAFDINLCFLRKCNRDLQTTRSIEIPACGGFMLAERTSEHSALFEEGKEAEFFGSDDELLSKVRFYLSHSEQRKKIAAAGRQRCLKSGYSNLDRMREMLNIVEKL